MIYVSVFLVAILWNFLYTDPPPHLLILPKHIFFESQEKTEI